MGHPRPLGAARPHLGQLYHLFSCHLLPCRLLPCRSLEEVRSGGRGAARSGRRHTVGVQLQATPDTWEGAWLGVWTSPPPASSPPLPNRAAAGISAAQGGWGSPARLRAAQPGSRPTQQGSESGVGREVLPAGRRPQAHKGPIVRLRLWAAGGCPVPHGEAPVASSASGGGHRGHQRGGGHGRAWLGQGTAHTGPACSMKAPILPALALPAQPGPHVVRRSPPRTGPGPVPGRPQDVDAGGCRGWELRTNSEQSNPGGFLEVARKESGRKWTAGGPSLRGRPPGVRAAPSERAEHSHAPPGHP